MPARAQTEKKTRIEKSARRARELIGRPNLQMAVAIGVLRVSRIPCGPKRLPVWIAVR
jgi:hypothetical protein